MQNKQLWLDLMRKFGPTVAAIVIMFFVTRVHADYEDGLDALFKGDYQTAVREFTLAADAGLDIAQYNLAILYYLGRGVEQDMEKAFALTHAAAQQGHLGAQANLASLYIDGSGVASDVNQGIAWFSAAGRGGHADSALTLANMYYDGNPVERDLVLAHSWASMAELYKHDEAAALLSKIERRMAAEEMSQARRLFARWQIEPHSLPAH
jgi:TPR repeat protein